MRDHLGVGLAVEYVAACDEFGAQLVVVLDDAVVHQRDPADVGAAARFAAADDHPGIRDAGAAAEVRVRVVHHRRAVRGPACVRNGGAALQVVFFDGGRQFVDPGGAAGAAQFA